MLNRRQINLLVRERNKGVNITMCAIKAGVSRNTAKKYLRQADPSKQSQPNHNWRTRPDPLSGIWDDAQRMLLKAPELEAKTLFEHLHSKPGAQVDASALRTFQRRVKQWRLKNGPDKEVFFTQCSKPGEVIAVDWTDMRKLDIRIGGQPFAHLMFHAVLPYSNWESVSRCRSESLLSLRSGLNTAFACLGRVPREILIDNSSSATHRLSAQGKQRGFNEAFLSVCEHFGIKARTTNVSSPQENGSCESLNGHFKRRMEQHLLLRGSRNFESEKDYDFFCKEVINNANALRSDKIAEELKTMREHLAPQLPDYTETTVRVNVNSTIRVCKKTYSVPSKLIGTQLKARIYETRILLLDGREEICELPRHAGDRGVVMDFRHVISWLIRKPGAFAGYRWREQMFPSQTFRAAYDHLKGKHEALEADRHYLDILHLASLDGVDMVANILEQLLSGPNPLISLKEVKALITTYQEIELEARKQPPLKACMGDYDHLLAGRGKNLSEEFTYVN
jgi:transposase